MTHRQGSSVIFSEPCHEGQSKPVALSSNNLQTSSSSTNHWTAWNRSWNRSPCGPGRTSSPAPLRVVCSLLRYVSEPYIHGTGSVLPEESFAIGHYMSKQSVNSVTESGCVCVMVVSSFGVGRHPDEETWLAQESPLLQYGEYVCKWPDPLILELYVGKDAGLPPSIASRSSHSL